MDAFLERGGSVAEELSFINYFGREELPTLQSTGKTDERELIPTVL